MKSCQICGVRPTGQYPAGWRCEDCTPAVCAGRAEPPTPDPARTLDGLRRAAGIVWTFKRTDSALVDDKAIASGRRRAAPGRYRAAQRAEQERKRKR